MVGIFTIEQIGIYTCVTAAVVERYNVRCWVQENSYSYVIIFLPGL